MPLARHYVTTRDSDHIARSADTERGLGTAILPGLAAIAGGTWLLHRRRTRT